MSDINTTADKTHLIRETFKMLANVPVIMIIHTLAHRSEKQFLPLS